MAGERTQPYTGPSEPWSPVSGDSRRVASCAGCEALHIVTALDVHGWCQRCADVLRLGGPVAYELRFVGEENGIRIYERVAVLVVEGDR